MRRCTSLPTSPPRAYIDPSGPRVAKPPPQDIRRVMHSGCMTSLLYLCRSVRVMPWFLDFPLCFVCILALAHAVCVQGAC